MALSKRPYEGKTLAILTGGGDTAALNASIEAIKSRVSALGFQVYGVRKGWKGLLGEGDIVNLTNQPYDGVYGGTALRSSRTNPFSGSDTSRVEQIITNLKRYKIDALVSIGGDDTNGAAKKLYEMEGIPVIGFPKTIDNDLKTKTIHNYNGELIEAVMCPGFPSAAKGVAELTTRLATTAESHSRIMVVEVMGRDAGWLTGSALMGGAEICLVPEFPITKERKQALFEKVKEVYHKSKKQYLIIAVAEGVRWYDEKTGKVDVVYASSEVDEYGHPRFGGISGVIASEISKATGLDARAQNLGYLARSGDCRNYDRRLVSVLADKVVDLILREDYGRMPVLSKLSTYQELEVFNTDTIDMGNIGNQPLQDIYYLPEEFQFSEQYVDFLSYFIDKPKQIRFDYNFPKVKPLM
ncbi:MAG TPA: 6-phosphofructokinase [Bacteroidales bacterium]|nr:6-phosphofructokinase [Bacteroidales bacterium]HOU99106.1 6-phosphofructokinase [Bacteroidales bacterium]